MTGPDPSHALSRRQPTQWAPPCGTSQWPHTVMPLPARAWLHPQMAQLTMVILRVWLSGIGRTG